MAKQYQDKNIFKSKKTIPLDLSDLVSYLADDKCKYKWYGVSFQIDKPKEEVIKPQEYNNAFSDIVNTFSEINEWIIQPFHPFKLYPWVTKNDNSPEIKRLKKLFEKTLTFKGYILLSSEQTKNLFEDLFMYSYITHSQDLIILNKEKPFIIILGQHLCLDIVSPNSNIIEEIISILKKYSYSVKRYT